MVNPLNRVPLPSLRAVEAVARLGSLRAAAEDLGVTPGAVSQQVIRCETTLGRPLFDRAPAGMAPREDASEVHALLRRGFADLAAAVAQAAPQCDDCLTVSVAPILASRWLIWRLPRFRAAHPTVRVRIDAELGLVEPGRGEVDLCVRVGTGGWPGVRAEPLASQVIFPVCSPAMAARIRDHADLARVPIIRETRANFAWSDWLAAEGRAEVAPGDGPLFSDAQLCLDAAISGEGVFLAFESLAQDPLARGVLAEPFRGRHATRNGYWLVTPLEGRVRRPVRAFADWLRQEFAQAGLGTVRGP